MTPQVYTMGQAPSIVVHSGTVEDWVVQNRALEDHIFHIHQIHFQVMAVNGVPVNDPAIWDTYDIPYWTGQGAYPSITIRVDFRNPNIIGTFVYHCHILQHEDAGMMAAIQVLPAGASSTASIASSAVATKPGTSTTLSASVISSVAGGSTPTGQVQFQNNGTNIGNPVTLANGVATLSVPGTSLQKGSNRLQAFYLGDTFYAESLSGTTSVTDAPFSLDSSTVTAPIGSAANATLNLLIATDFTDAVNFTCTMPSALTEAACFVNPSSVVGGGPVTLTVNTTPAHPAKSVVQHAGLAPFAGATLALLLLPLFSRSRRRVLPAMLATLPTVGLLFGAGCTSSNVAANSDPGTHAGMYNVTVTATDSVGTSPYRFSVIAAKAGVLLLCGLGVAAHAGTGGSISGRVSDPA